MPLFEYRCKYCGNVFEVLRPKSGDYCSCPKCGGNGERLISVFNFSVGWTLSEKSYEKGNPKELVRNV